MKDFAAIDFETANEDRASVCSVGIVVVKGGEITDRYYSLIEPNPNYYNWRNTACNGLTEEDTDGARNFAEVWKEIEPLIEGLPLVAHNKAFDEKCLKAALRSYGMDYPDYPFYCTLIASRKVFKTEKSHKLDVIAALCGYEMKNHHQALDDALACAIIALKIL